MVECCTCTTKGLVASMHNRQSLQLVLFIGMTEFKKSGYFVGVKYDEPLGKNDGR